MFTHDKAVTSARIVQITASFLPFSVVPKSYSTNVTNVTDGGYERTWPFSYKIGHRKFRSNCIFL